jgi:hypothetical protein
VEQEQERKLSGLPLDLREELAREPAELSPWWERNIVTRTLGHLLGFDGSQSRFLRCSSGGVLRVRPENAAGTVYPTSPTVDGAVKIAHSGGTAFQLCVDQDGSARVRMAGRADSLGLSIDANGNLTVELSSTTIAALASAIATALNNLNVSLASPTLSFDGNGHLNVKTN